MPLDARNGVPSLEARLDADEARLARDEARVEADEQRLADSRILGWFGVALGAALLVAVTALVLGVVALQGDVGSMQRSAADGSVGTAAVRDGAITGDKFALGAVGDAALATGAVSRRALAPRAVTGASVAGDTLTGADVRESSLGIVPSARGARDSARLGGLPANVFVSSLRDVQAASASDTSRVKGPLIARCPAGTRVVSGGAAIRGAAAGAALVVNAPSGSAGWTATARVAGQRRPTWHLVVSAVCARGG